MSGGVLATGGSLRKIIFGFFLPFLAPTLTVCCKADNDLFRWLRKSGIRATRFSTADEAIRLAPVGTGVLLLSGLPRDLSLAGKKKLRVYEEDSPENDPQAKTKQVEFERVIETGDRFSSGRILSIARVPITARQETNPWLVLGRVAGFDHIVFGMPKQTWPILWSPNPNLLVSSAALSHFESDRFAPAKAWSDIWREILRWLTASQLQNLELPKASVRPSYERSQSLPAKAESIAVKRAAQWFLRSHLLLTDSELAAYADADRWQDRVGPAPEGNGDGRDGILEGYSSRIEPGGSQPVRWWRRADCNSESAMALALSGKWEAETVAMNLAEFIVFKSGVSHDNPSEPSFGLVDWDDRQAGDGNLYGDDNARYILGLIATAGALKTHRFDDAILMCILANFRTTGKNGFRGDNLQARDIDRLGWQHFYEAETINLAPHFESYPWACYLWAYSKTGYRPLLERTEKAIGRMISAGENAWTWTNGIQQERARMLLCLSWLVRVDDTPEHRKWLLDMAHEVLAHQAACGALQEEVGDPNHGIAGPPRSNEAYGTAETPLIQENGDPLADMLYTTNFAFLGLHEAAAATGDRRLQRAEDLMANFLCRIQIRSGSHPEFDGAWFRAFDFGDWDYWASNSDLGWGAWSIETGWSVSWITAVMALRERHETLWGIDSSFVPNLHLLGQMGLR